MDFLDHHNSEAAQQAWIKMRKAQYWASGESLEYGQSIKGEPYVRMVYIGLEGCSMWYPLHKAAKKWGQ